MDATTFQSAERIQKSILSAGEKKLLIWIAERIPSWIHSDHLTILGFLGMVGAGFSYWLSAYSPPALVFAVLFLGLNWFGDSLDGTLARVRNQLRPRYGFYVDHLIDAVGALCLLGGIGLSGYMSPGTAMGLLITYFLLSIEIYLATYCVGKFNMSFMKWGPTELRILLGIGSIYLLFRPVVTLFGKKFLLFDVGGLCAIISLAIVIGITAVRNISILYQLETPSK
jgi:phosphatidylglycerophosphate synthase